MNLSDIKVEKTRRFNGHELGVVQLLWFFQRYLAVEKKEMPTEPIRQVLQTAFLGALFC